MPMTHTKDYFKTVFGERVGPVIDAMAPSALPVAGMAIGGAIGAPGGVLTASPMAGAGAATGEAFNIVIEDTVRWTQGLPPIPMEETLSRLGGQFAAGATAQAALPAAHALMRGFEGGVPKLRRGISLFAKGMGVELTAAEMTGSRVLTVGENIAKRSLGAGAYEAFGQRQAQQLVTASEGRFGVTLHEARQTLTRSDRFLNVLKAMREDFKADARVFFNRYAESVGGVQSTLGPDDLPNLFEMATEIRRVHRLRWSELQNTKLGGILKNIFNMQKAMKPRAVMSKDAEVVIRKAMGLEPTEPIDPRWLENNPQFAQLVREVKPGKLPTLEKIRENHTALGELAFPDRAEGAITVDAPVAAARRLWGAMSADLEAHAAKAGGPQALANLKQANEFYSVKLDALDTGMYKQLLAANKDLPAYSKRLFNPHDPGILRDAMKQLTPEGKALIQQQYVDDILVSSRVVNELPGGGLGFDGTSFANRLGRDRRVLDLLYTPEQVKGIMELGEVARLAATTSHPASGELVGILIASGQGSAIASGLIQGKPGRAMLGFAPYGLAKIFTNPTATKFLVNTIKGINTGRNVIASDVAQSIVSLLARAGASAGARELPAWHEARQ